MSLLTRIPVSSEWCTRRVVCEMHIRAVDNSGVGNSGVDCDLCKRQCVITCLNKDKKFGTSDLYNDPKFSLPDFENLVEALKNGPEDAIGYRHIVEGLGIMTQTLLPQTEEQRIVYELKEKTEPKTEVIKW